VVEKARHKNPNFIYNYCLGNVSADMDSVIGSMTLSYYYYLKYDKSYIPVININKDEFPLRLDIVHHF
jgi:inorganic pyrophosphatase/exopolyphosphatase